MALSLTDWLLWVLFPKRCPFCGKTIRPVLDCCENCKASLPQADDPACLGEKREAAGLDGFFAPFYYEGAAARAVREMKFHGRPQLARGLSAFLAQTLTESGESFDLITFVPADRKSLRRRGYNQAELLARFTAKSLGLPCRPVFKKVKPTSAQHTLSARERAFNLSGAFALTEPSLLEGKRLLICDDVATTGSTLRELSGLARRAGAKTVSGGCLCCTRLAER